MCGQSIASTETWVFVDLKRKLFTKKVGLLAICAIFSTKILRFFFLVVPHLYPLLPQEQLKPGEGILHCTCDTYLLTK